MNFILLLYSQKVFFYSTQLSKLEIKVVSNHLFKVNLFNSVLVETYIYAINCFFLKVDVSLNDYSSPLHKQNKANSSTTFSTFFFIWSIWRHRKTSKLSRETRTKAEFDHHCVKINTKAFHGWKSNVIFMEHACSYCM